MSVDAVILAGGYSTRADGFKMEFDIEGKTILQRCIEGFYDSCRKIIVVTGFKYEKIEKLVKDYEKVVTVYNDNYPKGMFTSIKKGISQVESEKFFLTPGDYPLINKKVIEEILTKSIKVKNKNKEVIIPSFYGKGGHPILADSSIVQDILVKSDDYNLREFLKNRKVAYEIIEDKSIILDVDTAQDYNEALSEFNKKLI
ncbi:nucleotidyltransferase family protein [Clostridium butyricum]|uniref:nucleotidyltransferase family protein n=1 Tax=Clostridium TaxID=1485 RepID=UPI0003D60DF8|nr:MULTISPECIES: nucleotidyltransferase family protein [Clostridium]ETI88786.1 MAG: Molybdopterin-guanine dinucleotide biosynthesis protein A [Clostridium butyricum DORA_1]ALR90758.1 molybdopterin-guanine dinucleotide biosynthesis protein A [Clostridium butyricum]ALS18995.1 molybdopterin-guanine dinucleotide biosynthesis protein A [Clostridium butyricum]ANF16182.1 molybdopterin-guanine dinucleotide biosynthesis protein A [Clostridium butyricum]AOR96092.1 molybdopterin-guanine dinucleotide bios